MPGTVLGIDGAAVSKAGGFELCGDRGGQGRAFDQAFAHGIERRCATVGLEGDRPAVRLARLQRYLQRCEVESVDPLRVGLVQWYLDDLLERAFLVEVEDDLLGLCGIGLEPEERRLRRVAHAIGLGSQDCHFDRLFPGTRGSAALALRLARGRLEGRACNRRLLLDGGLRRLVILGKCGREGDQ